MVILLRPALNGDGEQPIRKTIGHGPDELNAALQLGCGLGLGLLAQPARFLLDLLSQNFVLLLNPLSGF